MLHGKVEKGVLWIGIIIDPTQKSNSGDDLEIYKEASGDDEFATVYDMVATTGGFSGTTLKGKDGRILEVNMSVGFMNAEQKLIKAAARRKAMAARR